MGKSSRLLGRAEGLQAETPGLSDGENREEGM